MEEPSTKPTIALLQRAIAHYRLPLFQRLNDESPFEWVFYCEKHDQSNSTGLPTPELKQLPVRLIVNRAMCGPFVYQSGLKLNGSGYAGLMLDLGWTLLSNPRY